MRKHGQTRKRGQMRTAWATTLLLAGAGLLASSTRSEDAPQSKQYPPGKLGEVVRLGEEIIARTSEHPLSKQYVQNKLNCTSCHLDSGRHPQAGSFLETAAAYPAWSPREKRVITLEDRALNCFMRSQNGIRPPNGSQVSVAITTYITWLSEGSALKMNPNKPLGPNHTPQLTLDGLKPNIERGAKLYANQCADCHSEDGLGTDEGPPVWGNDSYNDGAGLSRVPKLASWLKVAMPLGDETLTTQEALDIAAFVNSHSRPKFVLSEHLPEKEKLGEYNGTQE
ncbi:c-type cytochrome [Thalassoglobus polymorphus]|uniref:Cytochrome c n=1 Tax=Thalassoglobus polymorphus TaxID=2527994 RepID=A0A517QGY6_9PLAN|nr:c-type cytochrome [Thalassoglobus polymorphus]QDT30899.1 Cytochrome c [Thalassoglobus polymorphus]